MTASREHWNYNRCAGLLTPLLIFVSLGLAGQLPAAEIAVGASRQEVIEKLGQPQGLLREKAMEMFVYPRMSVSIRDGKVVKVDAAETLAPSNELVKIEAEPPPPPPPVKPAPVINTASVAEPAPAVVSEDAPGSKSKGWFARFMDAIRSLLRKLMFWKKDAAPAADEPARTQPVMQVTSNGGARVELAQLLVPGKVTVVDFYADWCPPCQMVSPILERMVEEDPAVHLRKVDIVRWDTPVTRQYEINSVPNIRVFDRQGKLVGEPTSNPDQVKQYIAQAKRG